MLDEEVYEGELKDLRRFVRESDHESRLMEIELRKTKRALWLTRALNALSNMQYYACKANGCVDFESADYKMYIDSYSKWQWAERKCREKAKEFK